MADAYEELGPPAGGGAPPPPPIPPPPPVPLPQSPAAEESKVDTMGGDTTTAATKSDKKTKNSKSKATDGSDKDKKKKKGKKGNDGTKSLVFDAPDEQKPKNKRKVLIIVGVVIGLLVLIAAVVLAMYFLLPAREDVVERLVDCSLSSPAPSEL